MKRQRCKSVEEMTEGHRLLIIQWADHWQSSGWRKISEHVSEENMEGFFNVTVGWEIGRNRSIVKIAQSLDEADKCADVTTILIGDIVSEEEIVF